MNNFYAQYKYIKPYLQKKNVNEEDIGKKSYLQSPEDRAKMVTLVLCICCLMIVNIWQCGLDICTGWVAHGSCWTKHRKSTQSNKLGQELSSPS